MRSNSSAGQSGNAGRDLGDAADLVMRIGAVDAAQRVRAIDLQR